MNKIQGLYLLVDPRNDKIRYVGISKDINRRYSQHLKTLSENTYKANWIKNLVKNRLAPKLLIIEENLNIDSLRGSEIFWIDFLKSIGCNLTNNTNGGEGVWGLKHKPETIERFRKIHTNPTSETRFKMSLAKKGRTAHNKGVVYDANVRKRMSLSKIGKPSPRKGTKVSEQTLFRMKKATESQSIKVQCSNGVIYSSCNEVSRQLGISKTHIHRLIKNPNRVFRGLSFKKVN